MSTTPDRLLDLVAEVLGEPVTDDSTPETTEHWDSLHHLNLVLAIEEEFSVSLTMDDALEAQSVAALRALLRDRGVAV